MKVGIIGCGLMGSRRAQHLQATDELVACYDPAPEWPRATPMMNASRVGTIREVLDSSEVVVVATTHEALTPTAIEVVRAGLPCLLEKPCARTTAELAALRQEAQRSRTVVVPGFTLRHFPGVRAVQQGLAEGRYGRPLYLRAVYGHGGRRGYGTEWRCVPAKSGGGELMDQGVHLLDLTQHLFGTSTLRLCGSATSPRQWSPEVEDSVFMIVGSETGQIAQLHASWTEWRPTFRLDVLCEQGGFQVDGLGGAYGDHKAVFFTTNGLEGQDSWGDARDAALDAEWAAFLSDVRKPQDRLGGVHEVLEVVGAVYKAQS